MPPKVFGIRCLCFVVLLLSLETCAVLKEAQEVAGFRNQLIEKRLHFFVIFSA